MATDARQDRPRSFFDHLEEARRRIKISLLALLIALVSLLLLGLQPVAVTQSTTVWLPLPTLRQNETIPSQFVKAVSDYLVPAGVELVVLTPWEAVIVQLKVAFFLAAVVSSPVGTYEFWRFVAPGLKPRERRLAVRVSVPVVVLFVTGVLMSLLVVLPFTFPFLYGFAFGLGATPFLRLDEFLDFVLLFSLAFGLAFELPVVMYGLSAVGIVEPEFWKRNWRWAAVAIFIFGAVITPDGSGITMIIVALPMLLLYVGGYTAIRFRFRNRVTRKSS